MLTRWSDIKWLHQSVGSKCPALNQAHPRDDRAWWAPVYGVAQSRKRLKQLSSILLRGFLGGSDSKESACNAGDLGLILGSGRPLEKGMATRSRILGWRTLWGKESSLYSPWVVKSQTWVSDSHTHTHTHIYTYS